MDSSVQRLLSDKLYDKRKTGALELETIIRNAVSDGNFDKIAKIVHQLCHDYAYAVHQPHARNGGLIGLAAAAIALGSQVARYLREIIPPVLACFSDQDARVRYYACESMYNIAKVAKGEILLYFNYVFDALCKLAADTELSVKNGAELLDRLVKDIVSESAATYATIPAPETAVLDAEEDASRQNTEPLMAFSLPRFIPLLQERINVLNPFTRTFLVSWITLLDSIPDLELVVYLPNFLGGLLKYLSDPNQDVHTTTKSTLDHFLSEIKKIAAVKKGLAESKRGRAVARNGSRSSSAVATESTKADETELTTGERNDTDQPSAPSAQQQIENATTGGMAGTEYDSEDNVPNDESDEEYDDDVGVEPFDDEWIPGQDAQIDYQRILETLVTFLSESSEEEVQVTTLRWIESFMEICPEDILVVTPRLLAQVLPALSHKVDRVKQAANRVNESLMAYVMSLPEESPRLSTVSDSQVQGAATTTGMPASASAAARSTKENMNGPDRQSTSSIPSRAPVAKSSSPEASGSISRAADAGVSEPQPDDVDGQVSSSHTDLDYEAAANALTLQFLHEHEATRVAALAWLIMLHRKSPRKILAIQDATFPALLKTLSDPAESVVTRDLTLLSQISKSSDDSYFSSFMVNLLKLFGTDRRLLETRGNLIIRQLCMTLQPERIYRTMADCLEKDEDDIEFASIMVQNLNNNLITAPELQDLRKRLRNLDSRDGQTFFTVLFRAWCVNAVATFSLCLLAQAYEQAYNLLQIFADLEMTVNMLIQIDKLVQLLESPVFTYLRMQLLEPERFPHLYKCLYGLLMLLPQSSAFAALKNRLNSVSAIGYLHIAPRGGAASTTNVSTFERQNRLKTREEGSIRWTELLEKFRQTQDQLRRAQNRQLGIQHGLDSEADQMTSLPEKKPPALTIIPPGTSSRNVGFTGGSVAGNTADKPESGQNLGRAQQSSTATQGNARARSGLSHFRGLTKVGKKDKDKK